MSCEPPGLLQESLGLSGPKCPKSVPRVSPDCQKSPPHTPGTLSGHFVDTSERGARDTPPRTLSRTPPVFGDTLGDTPETLRARRARETLVAGRGVRNACLGVQILTKSKYFGVLALWHLALRNCSDFCDCDAHRRPQKSLAISESLHCDLRLRWKVASDLRFRVAISEPETPSF